MWNKFIQTTKECQRLDYVQRYSTIPVTVRESVSTHSYWVSLYSAMIHQMVNPSDKVTLSYILLHALTHDMPEMVTGDFVRTFKYSFADVKIAIDKAESDIIEVFPSEIKNLYEVGDCDRDYIESVVKAADFMSLHNFMIRELDRGNTEVKPYVKTMIRDLSSMAEKNKGVIFKFGYNTMWDPEDFYIALVRNVMNVLKDTVSPSFWNDFA